MDNVEEFRERTKVLLQALARYDCGKVIGCDACNEEDCFRRPAHEALAATMRGDKMLSFEAFASHVTTYRLEDDREVVLKESYDRLCIIAAAISKARVKAEKELREIREAAGVDPGDLHEDLVILVRNAVPQIPHALELMGQVKLMRKALNHAGRALAAVEGEDGDCSGTTIAAVRDAITVVCNAVEDIIEGDYLAATVGKNEEEEGERG